MNSLKMTKNTSHTNSLWGKLLRLSCYGIPYMIIAGLLDYRFHNYYFTWLNHYRPLINEKMFDFFSVFDGYVYIVVFLFLVNIVKNVELRSNVKKIISQKKVLLTAGVVLLASILSVATYSPVEPIIHGVGNYLHEIFFVPLFVFVILATVETEQHSESSGAEKNQAFEKTFLLNLVIAFSLLGALTIYEFFNAELPGASRDFLDRAVWPYIDPFFDKKAESANWLSYLSAPLALVAVTQYKRHSTTLTKVMLLVGIVIGISVLILSKSYTGIAAFSACIGLYFFTKIKTIKMKVALVLLLLFIGGIFVYSQRDTRKFQILMGNYNKENSLQRRAQIYTVSTAMLLEQPVVGIGPGNYQSAFKTNMTTVLEKPIPQDEVPPHPHNLILDWWSEIGIGGLIAIISIYLITIRGWFMSHVTKTGLVVITYFLIHGFLDVPYGISEVANLFWIMWAIVVRNYQHR